MLAEVEGVSIWNLKATRASDKKGTVVSLSLVFSSYDQSGLKSHCRGPRFSPNLGVEKWLVGYNRKHFFSTSKFPLHVVTNNSMNLEVWKGVRQSQSYYVPVYKVGLENNSLKAKGISKFLCSSGDRSWAKSLRTLAKSGTWNTTHFQGDNMDSDSIFGSSSMGSPCSHCVNTHEALHHADYELQVKVFQLMHAQTELSDKLMALQFQLSQVIDEMDALRSMIMELKINNEAQAATATPMEDKRRLDIDLNHPPKA